jgi:hypothetical protein
MSVSYFDKMHRRLKESLQRRNSKMSVVKHKVNLNMMFKHYTLSATGCTLSLLKCYTRKTTVAHRRRTAS